jgi:hypothetical protein
MSSPSATATTPSGAAPSTTTSTPRASGAFIEKQASLADYEVGSAFEQRLVNIAALAVQAIESRRLAAR